MKKKIYLHLSGGLGNQLFQYAAAKQISIRNNAQLILDKKTGFVTDLKFKRKFCLNYFNLKNVVFSKTYFFYFFRIFKKIFFLKKLFYFFFSTKIIDEFYSFDRYHIKIKNISFDKNLFMMGLFQSEKYFNDDKKFILNEIFPPSPKNKKFFNESKELDHNSIAVCVRSFEDLPKNLDYTVGGLTNYSFYSKALKIFLKKIKKPKFYFFSTRNINIDNLLRNVKDFQKYDKKIITREEGYKSDIQTLWLLSNFRNLIISNSTFYWWVAYFAQSKFAC